MMLQSLGATVEEVHLPHSRYSVAAYYVIAPCEASSNLARYEAAHYGFRATSSPNSSAAKRSPLEQMMIDSRSQGFGEEVQRRIMLGTFALSAGHSDAYYKQALKVRRLISNDYRTAFEKVDLLLGPVVPTTAFVLGEKLSDPVQMYLEDLFTVEANLAGLPAISIPCGFNGQGLPLAVQLQGPQLSDARLLQAAYQLQKAGLFEPRMAAL
jgi:aspartyl-tRNA(Asn)/glutamyl-tRNA(Gln) amidotransferase subunit A